MAKKVDFSKIIVRDITGGEFTVTENGEVRPFDFAQQLGNALFYRGTDIRLADLGREIYHHRPVDLEDDDVVSILKMVKESFQPFVLLSVNPQIDELLK